MEWYAFKPDGTLIFKGAEPMSMGADHHASSIFPPAPQTIAGALRTAVLHQRGISITRYKNEAPEDIVSTIGQAGKKAPFMIVGPLFRFKQAFYVPAPYSWFVEKSRKEKSEEEKFKAAVFHAEPVKTDLVKTGAGQLMWVKNRPGDMLSLGGFWLAAEELFSSAREKHIYKPQFFFVAEPRTGIALNRNRSVRSGHLYTFEHIRLKPGVDMAFGSTINLPLAEKGVLKLGAEKRFGSYQKIAAPVFKENLGSTFLSLSFVESSTAANNAVIATGKPRYIGGWDLCKGFHKPMQGHYPAGSVFSEKLYAHFLNL